jgi:hypothetical protein
MSFAVVCMVPVPSVSRAQPLLPVVPSLSISDIRMALPPPSRPLRQCHEISSLLQMVQAGDKEISDVSSGWFSRCGPSGHLGLRRSLHNRSFPDVPCLVCAMLLLL